MKTIQKTISLFLLVLSVAACTQQTIEPAKPVSLPNAAIVRTDTSSSAPVGPGTEANDQPDGTQPRAPHDDEKPGRGLYQIASVDNPQPAPAPVDVPRQTVMPVMKADTLAQ